MEKTCKWCQSGFVIDDRDSAFYEKVSPLFGGRKILVDSPTWCPECRQMRRLTYRNERNFYKRKCDLTGESIISVYPQDFVGKVFSHEAFYGNNWNATDYGRDFDFSRSFFEQFLELALEAPRLCTVNMSSENSVYTNHSAYNKNCYMCINTGYSEDLMYCTNYNLYNKDCVDCLAIMNSERCYFCANVKKAQVCTYLYWCSNLDNCHFCYDCQSCSNCFGFNLRHKKFCIFNKQYSEKEYERYLCELMPKSWAEFMEMFEKWKILIRDEAIHKNLEIEKCVNSFGDHLENCKNVDDSFYAFGSEDCRYCYDCGDLKDCYDCTEPFNEELHYELQGSFNGYHNIFSLKNLEAKNTIYCQYCVRSQDCFGCFGMNGGQYRILNKQYTRDEYEKLVSEIIEYMRETGEWGEYFPIEHSPYAYNETVANDYYPLGEEDVLSNGWRWRHFENRGGAVSEGVKDVVKCEISGCTFRLMGMEKSFYKMMDLPIPQRHFEERVKMRLGLRNSRQLRSGVCEKCGCEIETTCAVGVKNVYCKKCYLKEVY